MIPVPSGMRVWLAVGRTDMRRGMKGLSLQVQETLGRDPFAGDLFVFLGAGGNPVKILWHDGLGLSHSPRGWERGRFDWPSANKRSVAISAAQLTYMLDGIDWRNPVHTFRLGGHGDFSRGETFAPDAERSKKKTFPPSWLAIWVPSSGLRGSHISTIPLTLNLSINVVLP